MLDETSISKYEPLSRYCIEKNIKVATLFLVWLILFKIGLMLLALLDGTFMRTDDDSGLFESIVGSIGASHTTTYYIENYSIFFNHGIVYPLMFVLLVSMSRRIPQMFQSLVDHGIVQLSPKEEKEYSDMVSGYFNVKSVQYVIVVVVLLLAVTYGIQSSIKGRFEYLIWKPGRFAPLLHILINAFIWYVFIQISFKIVQTIRLLRRIFLSGEYSVTTRLFHPDDCGGLKKIGDLAILVNIAAFTVGIGLSLHISVIILLQKSSFLDIPIHNYVGLLSYALLAPTLFFLLIGQAHKKMRESRTHLLQTWKAEIEKSYQSIHSGLKADAKLPQGALEHMQNCKKILEYVKNLNTWPFNIIPLRVSVGSLFLPILLPLLIEVQVI